MIIKKIDEDTIKVNTGPIDTSIANAIRRSMISYVKTMALDVAKISENNGLLPDEMIAHRIGLIPIKRKSDLVSKATFRMDVSNNADHDSLLTVYSKDLIPDSDDAMIPDPNIIIAKLARSQRISLVAEATLGTGYIHAKWNPTAGLAYELKDDLSYEYTIETIGSMEPEKIFVDAIDALIEKIDSYVLN